MFFLSVVSSLFETWNNLGGYPKDKGYIARLP